MEIKKIMKSDDIKDYLECSSEWAVITENKWALVFSEEVKKCFFGFHGNGIMEIVYFRDDIEYIAHAINALRKLAHGKYTNEEIKTKFGKAEYKGLL
jgi:hypothetical protein